MSIGDRITNLRIEAHMTQSELADKLFVSRELVSKWENDTRTPTYDMITNLANLFNVTSDSIITRDEMLLIELLKFIPKEYTNNSELFIRQLNNFLNNQNVRDSSVFIRRYYFSDEITKISTNYNISEYHVGMILMRTRKKLLRFLKENYK